LYITLMCISVYVDAEKTQKWRLKELFQYLLPSANIIDIMQDLKMRMIREQTVNILMSTKKQSLIVNPLAFESYLH
jgi:hypothetical protein